MSVLTSVYLLYLKSEYRPTLFVFSTKQQYMQVINDLICL